MCVCVCVSERESEVESSVVQMSKLTVIFEGDETTSGF